MQLIQEYLVVLFYAMYNVTLWNYIICNVLQTMFLRGRWCKGQHPQRYKWTLKQSKSKTDVPCYTPYGYPVFILYNNIL